MFSDSTIAQALSPSIQELILLPTEKCNFRCTYCYEDFSIGRMTPSIVGAVKQFITNRVPSLKQLTLSWFGGEPLLAPGVIRDIGRHAHQLSRDHRIVFHAGMTTNGYLLTPSLFDELMSFGHNSFQITLDGDAEWHDRTRIQANRRPTFDRIWSHLLAYRARTEHFEVMLRLHVHRHNIESMRRLYAEIAREFGSDPRFSTYFHKVSPLGGDNQEQLKQDQLNHGDYEAALRHIRADAEGAGRTGSEAELDGYICYAARPNSLMIRADGRVGKCTVALEDPRNQIGRLRPDGTLDISNPKLQRWLMGYGDLSEKTLGCPLSTLHQYEAVEA